MITFAGKITRSEVCIAADPSKTVPMKRTGSWFRDVENNRVRDSYLLKHAVICDNVDGEDY